MPKKSSSTSQLTCSLQDVLDYLDPLRTREMDQAINTQMILHGMRMAKDNALVQEQGCERLADLVYFKEAKEFIVSEGGIAAIVAAMTNHPNHVSLQKMGCAALNNFCIKCLQARRMDMIPTDGTVVAVLRALKQHQKNVSLAGFTCNALSSLLASRQATLEFAKEGGPALVLTVMRTYVEVARLQKHCCMIIQNSTFTSQQALWDVEAIDAVTCAMKKHFNADSLLSSAYAAFWQLADICPQWRDNIWASGVIDDTLQAMESYPDNEQLQMYACYFLSRANRHAPGNESNHKDIVGETDADVLVSKGAMGLVIKAMEKHLKSADLQEVGVTVLMQLALLGDTLREQVCKEGYTRVVIRGIGAHLGKALGLLKYFRLLLGTMISDTMAKAFVDEGGIEAVVEAMKSLPECAELNRWGLEILSTAVQYVKNLHSKLIAQGAIDAAITSMLLHQKGDKIQVHGVTLFFDLYCEDSNILSHLAAKGAIAAIAQAMPFLEVNFAEAACEMMSLFPVREDKTVARKMISEGGLAAMIAALNKHMDHNQMVQQVLYLFAECERYPDYQSLVGRSGGISAIVKSMDMHSYCSKVQVCGLSALGAMCTNHVENKDRARREGGVKAVVASSLRFPDNYHIQATATAVLGRVGDGNEEHLHQVISREYLKLHESCTVCRKSAMELNIRRLRKCSACTIAPVYCSEVCQKAAWKSHKKDCKANPKLQVDMDELVVE